MKSFRFFFVFVFMFVFFHCNARVLHVGEKVYNLYTEKYTTPSLCFDVSGTVYYASLIPGFVENGLHVNYNDTVYSCCDVSSDYCIENGKLYWAHPDLYLKSSGLQYIDTNIVPDLSTAIEIAMADTTTNTYSLFGVKTGLTVMNETGFGVSLESGKFGFFRNGTSVSAIDKDNNFHVYYLSNVAASIDGVSYDFASASEPISAQRPMFMFGFNHGGIAYDKTMSVKYLKIWSGDTLIRYMVPVPEGLVIGDYTVPSNGMFDIVSQTFYSNSGIGKFQYGKDISP